MASTSPTQSLHQFSQSKAAVVIGGGVAGVSTAAALQERGYEVLLLEANAKGPGEEASKVSAGGMQQMNNSLDRKTFFATLKQIFLPLSKDKFFYMDFWACLKDPHFWRWALGFTWNSLIKTQDVERETEMLEMTCETIAMLENVFNNDWALAKEAGYSHKGAIRLATTQQESEEFQRNPRWTSFSNEKNVRYVDPKELQQMLPWMSPELISFGALFQTESARGNSETFTKHLAKKLKHVVVDCTVEEVTFDSASNRIISLQTSRGNLEISPTTAVVVAAGSWTAPLMHKMGFYCPVYPLKGYDLILQHENFSDWIVASGKTYMSPLGKELRFCSIGEFSGLDTKP
jgi:glycine/D-amino acid oxidase-like deaminating enzyme